MKAPPSSAHKQLTRDRRPLSSLMRDKIITFEPGSFEPSRHFYPRAQNAMLHPTVRAFFRLGNERIAKRYVHLHPEVSPEAVKSALNYTPQHFRWAGADLLHVTTARGQRRVVLLETNSSPSGQKSMPLLDDASEAGGYERLLRDSFLPALRRRGIPEGGLAVLYDKNEMEASGYAACLADLTGEPVHLVPCFDGERAFHRMNEGVLEVDLEGSFIPIRGALRYVTQRPWNRLPALSRSLIYNPILACLAGGRNKALAARAYELFNGENARNGVHIHTPRTYWDVSRDEIPLWIAHLGGFGVIKVPYSNAGQGVYTITRESELEEFMSTVQGYDRFIVQALIGNSSWSSETHGSRFFHVGTVPDKRGDIHVADLRFMVGGGPNGFFPVAVYARRARLPLAEDIESAPDSWSMLGTNLSIRREGGWDSDTDRLLLMDTRDFGRLGLGLDDFIEAYLQTTFSVIAIDRMAERLLTKKGKFRRRFFASMAPDEALQREILG